MANMKMRIKNETMRAKNSYEPIMLDILLVCDTT